MGKPEDPNAPDQLMISARSSSSGPYPRTLGPSQSRASRAGSMSRPLGTCGTGPFMQGVSTPRAAEVVVRTGLDVGCRNHRAPTDSPMSPPHGFAFWLQREGAGP